MSDTKKEWGFNIVNMLSLLIILGYMVAMPMWMWWPPEVKPEVLAIINQMMGAWGMAFATVVAFHLGSSKGAKDAAASTRKQVDALSTTVASTAAAAAVSNGAPKVSAAPVPPAAP